MFIWRLDQTMATSSNRGNCWIQSPMHVLDQGVEFTWAFDDTGTVHARDIVTDTGWEDRTGSRP